MLVLINVLIFEEIELLKLEGRWNLSLTNQFPVHNVEDKLT